MASKLLLYNNALLLCGERKLASLTEDREPRHLLDDVYDGGAIRTCLEAADWNFATRTVKAEYDPAIDPDFGFRRGFEKPSDWCRTTLVSANEYFQQPLKNTHFADEAGYWFADMDTIYVKYISDLDAYGGNPSNWTETFARYFEAYLAHRIAYKVTRSKSDREEVERELKKRYDKATTNDARNSGSSVPPEGTWNRSRRGGYGFGRRDGGSRSSLVG